MERFVERGRVSGGYAVALTNVRTYWTEGRADVIDSAFRMHKGLTVHGKLMWQGDPADGTIGGRRSAIDLRGRYLTRWENYSRPDEGPGGEFRYLLLDVGEALAAARGRASP